MSFKAPRQLSKILGHIDKATAYIQGKGAVSRQKDINFCPTDLIISVCSLKDIETWSVAAEYIVRNIQSKSYLVIVPGNDLDEFTRCTPGEIQIISEEQVIPSSFIKIIEDHLDSATGQSKRAGWIYQQFFKIQGAIDSRKDRIALWDSDTVPLKKINFFDDKLRARFYTGDEYHPPYFDMINCILGCTKSCDKSFIAQSIPFRRQLILDLCKDIENRTGISDWKLGILSCMRSELGESPFSEYETIGTYAMSRLNFGDRPIPQVNSDSWKRNGYEIIGPATNLPFFIHSSFYNVAFVSFERWSKPFAHYSESLKLQYISTTNSGIALRIKFLASIAYYTARLDFKAVKKVIRYFISPDPFRIFDSESEDSKIKRFLSDFFSASGFSTILQIGANDGIMNDPLRPFLPTHQGPVILVEALPYYCNMLGKLYSKQNNIRVVNSLIASTEEFRELFYINHLVADEMDGDGPPNRWAHGQGAFNKETIISWIYDNQFRGASYRLNLQRYIDSVEKTLVKSITLASLAKECNLSHIELLVIDVQGAELEVLSSLRGLKKLPRFIIYEDDSSLEHGESIKLESLLVDCGYVFIAGSTDRLWGLDSPMVSRSSLGFDS